MTIYCASVCKSNNVLPDVGTAVSSKAIGNFGCKWTNKAGIRMKTFIGTHELCLPTTFFQKNLSSCPTWFSNFNKRGYQIDHFITKRADLKRIVDAGTAIRNSIESDHRAIFMKIRIARNLPNNSKSSSGRVSRDQLYDDSETIKTKY